MEIKLPFHAKMTGTITYNEADLPETVVFGLVRGIGLYINGGGTVVMEGDMSSTSKENFLRLATEHPEKLQFSMEKDF